MVLWAEATEKYVLPKQIQKITDHILIAAKRTAVQQKA